MPRTVPRPLNERIALIVIGTGFGIGMITHALDFWWFGWAPYTFGPPLLNTFWNALVLIDAVIVALLLAGWTRSALTLGMLTMLGDVCANSYAWTMLDIAEFAPALIAQTGFLGFLLGSIGFLWRPAPKPPFRRRPPATTRDASPALPLSTPSD